MQLAEKSLRDRGWPRAPIDWLPTKRLPDEIKADKTLRYLKERGVKSAIILITNYKARRLGRTYRRLGAQIGAAIYVLAKTGSSIHNDGGGRGRGRSGLPRNS